MNRIRWAMPLLLAGVAFSAQAAPPGTSTAPEATVAAAPGSRPVCPALLDSRQPRLQDEAMQDLCQYAGQVVLVVNTASFCGFTPQYRALEQLHERYRARGFAVLGFPSNDFGQEAGTNAEIAQLCEGTFGVKFPMFSSSRVTGPQANPVFARLARTSGSAPQWNFHKYLIGRDGRLVAAWPSAVTPDDARMVTEIERTLAAVRP